MNYLLWALAIFLSLLLQSRVSILGIFPDLTLVLAYYAGIRYGERKGLLLGSLIGALEDSISLSILGPNLLAKGVVGYASYSLLFGGFLRWTPLLGIIAISLFTFIDNSIVFLSRSLFDKTPADISTAFFISSMQALLNAPLGMFIRPRHED